MKQVVDLFPPHLRRRAIALGADHMAKAVAGLVLVLALVWAATSWRASRAEVALADLETELESASGGLQELATRYPAIEVDSVLVAEADALAQRRRANQQVLELLAREELGNQAGFSPHLDALARHPVEGIWFDTVAIDAGGREISISGSAIEAERVPRLLRALGEKPPFEGRSFRTLRIARDEGQGIVSFALSTRAFAQAGSGAP